MILVSTIGFTGMPYLVMWTQSALDIPLWVKHPRWLPFGQGQTLNKYNFPQNRSRCMILVSTMGFSDMSDLMVWSEMPLHCG